MPEDIHIKIVYVFTSPMCAFQVKVDCLILNSLRGFESLRTSLSIWRKSQSSTDNDCPFPEPGGSETDARSGH